MKILSTLFKSLILKQDSSFMHPIYLRDKDIGISGSAKLFNRSARD